MCVTQACTVGIGPRVTGRGQTPPIGLVETTLITPELNVTPVSGLLVRSTLTDRVRKPSGVSKQLQHSLSSCAVSNTKMAAHTLGFTPVKVPGLSNRTVPSGAPEV